MRQLRHILEAVFGILLYGLLKILPLDMASALGGWVASGLGPYTLVHRVASHNLAKAMPELTAEEHERILHGMWNNLGRIFAEYPHLNSPVMQSRVRVVGDAAFCLECEDKGLPVLLMSGHIGNWELLPLAACRLGVRPHLFYRAANNRWIDAWLKKIRLPNARGLHAKGPHSARKLAKAMHCAEPVAMLVDQKSNDGIAASFFGMPAMTSGVAARLVQQFDAALIPAFCRRVQGANFEVEILPPLALNLCGDDKQNMNRITQQVNDLIEARIRQDPTQWFWVHKRWPHSKIVTQRKDS